MPVRILIVDDNPLVRNLLRKALEAEPGWEVCGEAGNGKEGVESAQTISPDLVVLDLSMPVMNSLEAARVLNEREESDSDFPLCLEKQWIPARWKY